MTDEQLLDHLLHEAEKHRGSIYYHEGALTIEVKCAPSMMPDEIQVRVYFTGQSSQGPVASVHRVRGNNKFVSVYLNGMLHGLQNLAIVASRAAKFEEVINTGRFDNPNPVPIWNTVEKWGLPG